MLKVSKHIKACIVFFIACIMMGISVVATKAINNNSYNIREIATATSQQVTKETEEALEPNLMTRRDAIREDIDRIDRSSMPDDEYAVMRSLSVLLNSPMGKSIESAEYEVKQIQDEWVTKFSCSEFDLFVSCDSEYVSPIGYTCSRKFTEEELEFFHSLGSAWEVENEDGTYSVYYT